MRRVLRWMLGRALSVLVVGTAQAQNFRVQVSLPGWSRHPIALDSVAQPFVMDAPKAMVFAAFAGAMDELKIPIETRDQLGGLVGNATIQARFNFAGLPMTRIVECGLGATGPNANGFRVHIALMAIMDSIGPSKTRVRMALAAGALDPSGAAKEPATCGSSGVLEEKIIALARKRL